MALVVTNTPRPWDPHVSAARALMVPKEVRGDLPPLRVHHVQLDVELEEAVRHDWDLEAAVRALWAVGWGRVAEEISEAFEYAALGSWSKGDRGFTEALLRYVLSSKIGMEPGALVEVVRRALSQRGEVEMTTYVEYFRQQGVEEGIQGGVE